MGKISSGDVMGSLGEFVNQVAQWAIIILIVLGLPLFLVAFFKPEYHFWFFDFAGLVLLSLASCVARFMDWKTRWDFYPATLGIVLWVIAVAIHLTA